MQVMPRKLSGLLWVALMLLLVLSASSCRSRSEDTNATTDTTENSASTEPSPSAADLTADSETAGQAAAAAGYQSTPINPSRTAYLTAESEGAQINVRSQPTTQSESLGYGFGGDEVELLRLAEGEGGYSWYFLKLAESTTEGWIRGDFIDTTGQTAAATPAAEATEPDDEGACGRDRQEAYFETDSFSIYICNTGDGLRYVGLNKENQESLVTEDVSSNQGTYVAIDGSYQYHINDNTLAVYQINQGNYNQLVGEEVIRHERFVY